MYADDTAMYSFTNLQTAFHTQQRALSEIKLLLNSTKTKPFQKRFQPSPSVLLMVFQSVDNYKNLEIWLDKS